MSRGVSFEEKRKRIEKIFHETSEFYQLKDIEVLGPKKGVGMHSIKEVVQSLVDDGLLLTDKIAQSTYYWSYPSTAIQAKKLTLENLTTKYEREWKKNQQLINSIEELRQSEEEMKEHALLMKEYEEQREINRNLCIEINRYKETDPEVFESKEKVIQISKEAINRCTDNIWQTKSYCINKLGVNGQDFDQMFNLNEEYFETI